MIGFEKCKWEHSCGYELCMPEFCKEYEAVPITNADHIRSMSDEELADFLMLQVQMSKASNAAEILSGFEEITKIAWLNWFKAPYKEKEE